jgi:ATPase subunit of ABC transporter with duplicated ATPase domains
LGAKEQEKRKKKLKAMSCNKKATEQEEEKNKGTPNYQRFKQNSWGCRGTPNHQRGSATAFRIGFTSRVKIAGPNNGAKSLLNNLIIQLCCMVYL